MALSSLVDRSILVLPVEETALDPITTKHRLRFRNLMLIFLRYFICFHSKGFNEGETVGLLGGHNIGKMSCEFIHNRLYNFNGTGQPDPTLAPDLLDEMRLRCRVDNSTVGRNGLSESMQTSDSSESASGTPSFEELSSSVHSGADFDTQYYQRLLTRRGLLFADQQLMAAKKTEGLVRAYASDDGSTFRMDFAGALMKMSNLNVLTSSQGRVQLN